MTRLEQALRWWREHDHSPIPERHLDALDRAGCLVRNDKEEWYELTDDGCDLLELMAKERPDR